MGQFRQAYAHFRQFPPEHRQKVFQRYHQFQQLPPAERARVLEEVQVSSAEGNGEPRSICFESRLKRRLGWHFTSAGAAALPKDAPEPHPQSAMRAAATCQISRARRLKSREIC
jgi:Protein of unknown function (DUF3106)